MSPAALAKTSWIVFVRYGSLRAGMMIAVFGILYEALGDADVDELGEALPLDDGLADSLLDGLADELGDDDKLLLGDGLELGEPLGDADGEGLALDDELGLLLGDADGDDDGLREALGLELVSGSSAFGRILRATSSSCVTNLPVASSRITQS